MVINMSWKHMTKNQDIGMLPSCQEDIVDEDDNELVQRNYSFHERMKAVKFSSQHGSIRDKENKLEETGFVVN